MQTAIPESLGSDCLTLDPCEAPDVESVTLESLLPIDYPAKVDAEPHVLTLRVENNHDCPVTVTVELIQQLSGGVDKSIGFWSQSLAVGETEITCELDADQIGAIDEAYGTFEVSLTVESDCECGSGSGPVDTDCCENNLPRVLYCSIQAVDGCPGLDGVGGKMIYNDVGDWWEVNGMDCQNGVTGTISLQLICRSGVWELSGFTCATYLLNLESVECDPLELLFEMEILEETPCSCCDGPSTVQVVITE